MIGTIQLLVFQLDQRRYGLRLAQVHRVIRAVDPTPLPESPDTVLGVIDLQGSIVPVLNTRRRFGLEEKEIGVESQFVVASTQQRTVALVVDNVEGIIERPADQLVASDKILENFDQIEGVVRMEDGLIIIHDLEKFLSLEQENALESALGGQVTHGR